jgi:hypothetical protein
MDLGTLKTIACVFEFYAVKRKNLSETLTAPVNGEDPEIYLTNKSPSTFSIHFKKSASLP